MSEMDKVKKENIGVRMSSDFKLKLEKLAKKNKRSLSDYIRIIMEEIIEDAEKNGLLND